MTTPLHIHEIFASLQGEGVLTGVPSVFVRTTGCNLRCVWCDTPETSWRPRGERVELDDVLAEVERWPAVRHVVLTGGEPVIAKHAVELAAALRERGYHLTIETAGTVWADGLTADLWSISPKLAHSTPPEGPWRERHEAARYRPDVIRRMMADAEHQLKFVVADPSDVDEVRRVVRDVGAAPERVLLMPEGRSPERLDAVGRALVPVCLDEGFRLSDRFHIRLFGDTPGT